MASEIGQINNATFNAEPPEDSNSEWTLFTMQQRYSFLSIYEDCPRRVRAIFYIMTAYSLPTWTKKKGRNIPRPLLKLQIHGQYFSGAAIPPSPSSVNEKLRTFAILGIGKRLSKYCLSGVYSVWWKQLLHQWELINFKEIQTPVPTVEKWRKKFLSGAHSSHCW